MAPKTGVVGGGPSTGLAKDFTSWLDNVLNTGGKTAPAKSNLVPPAGQAAGADPVGQTQGISGVISDLLSGGGGNIGGSLAKLIQMHQTQDIGDLRARFGASGGVAFGTPAAYAESAYRAKAAPEAATAIGSLQLSAIMPLLNMITQLSGKGIPQAENLVTPNPWLSGIEALSGGAQGAGAILKGLA